jgi:NADP-dependent alcohol dehydrogenase
MIHNYELYNPTRLVFGESRIEELVNYLPEKSKILFLYGQGSIKNNGIYDKVIKILNDFDYIEFGGIEPNPMYETLMKAVDLGKKEQIDFILAVGGGSVIDGAKFVAAAIPFDKGDPWSILKDNAEVETSIPIGTILTLPATGSEMNRGAVISKASTKEKFAFLTEKSFPLFSILDISVLKSLPKRQIANGIVDAFIHVTEQYMTYPVNAVLQDRFAESILKTLIEEGTKFYNNKDLEAGANLMFSATMALNGVISAGVPTDWSIHMIGHELTALYGIDHARTLAVILPALYLVKIDNKLDKLAQYAQNVWGITHGTKKEMAINAIEKTEEFFNSLNIPTKLSKYNIELNSTTETIIARFEKRGVFALGENGIVKIEELHKIFTTAWV